MKIPGLYCFIRHTCLLHCIKLNLAISKITFLVSCKYYTLCSRSFCIQFILKSSIKMSGFFEPRRCSPG